MRSWFGRTHFSGHSIKNIVESLHEGVMFDMKRIGIIIFACLVFVTCLLQQKAIACRGSFWPRTAEQAAPNDVVIKANLVNAWHSKRDLIPIMGSNVSFLYRVEIVEVVKPGKTKPLSKADKIYVHSHSNICELFRPWNSSDEVQIRAYREAGARLLILRRWQNSWTLVGGT